MSTLLAQNPGRQREAKASRTRRLPIQGQQLALVVLIALLAAVFTTQSPEFLSVASIENLLRSASMFGIVGLGLTIVVISTGSIGGIDLSVGSMMALGGAIGAGLLGTAFGAANPVQLPAALSMLIALVVTAALGALSGLLISLLKLAPFAVTLGMMSVARGLTYLVIAWAIGSSNTAGVTFSDPLFDVFGLGMVGPIPTITVLFLVLAALIAFVLKATTFGRSLFVLGGNAENARLAGINVRRTIIIVFALSGLLAGLGGLILTGRLSSASPLAATGYELEVIMVAVIGGTSLAGGRGSILGTVLAAILVSEIDTGLDMMNVDSFYQYLVKGTILVVAVVLDKAYQARSSRKLVQQSA
ncbi:monosaccharide ABC transporter membrane protein, CUT2 family [Micromonospora pattaloongensis]|uniref:Monosaccharide ABC transporter membrane protein, CUT2 family n=1 Tax=Micromonospora pattaloongensis TaxID=405436 RepID=A0A1H3SXC5_9ACTN|nr:ABC transporter permease [Micromonospora pattaloongensis]SDZ42676.1 monosaccharide ABC transporter membrane protein, CUT2 family [Micromonospora pattaloongensis]